MMETPVVDFWDIPSVTRHDQALSPDSPLRVDTEEARGHFSFQKLLRSLGVDNGYRLRKAPETFYGIFCGHRGCGKSTELNRLAERLHGRERFFVIHLDAAKDLDPNNLGFPDVLMALARELIAALQREGIEINEALLHGLQDWFAQRIEHNEKTKSLASEIKAGAKAGTGLPFIGELFAQLTNSLRINSTYKEELRFLIKNTFSQFAAAFQELILAAEGALRRQGGSGHLLFIVDGTDRLTGEDSRRFFIEDVHQLQQIPSRFLYCAPIHLLHLENQTQQHFDHFILPMIKICEADGAPNPVAWETMREMIRRRIDERMFSGDGTLDLLVEHSGGNPRELLRLVDYAYQSADDERIDRAAAEAAVKSLATDYKRFLKPEDYARLARVDREGEGAQNEEGIWTLLYNLALLEYNSFWRRSHPAVRTLDGYRRAQDAQGD